MNIEGFSLLGNLTRAKILRFTVFGAVALCGLGVQLALLSIFFQLVGLQYTFALGLSILLAMVFNFVIHNILTFGDHRLRGIAQLRGLFSFCLASIFGGLLNTAIATFFFTLGWHWALSALMGAVAGGFVNFALASRFTWKHSDRSIAKLR